jgi:hypothetical protein
VRAFANGGHYILEVEAARKDDVAALMAYRGLTFSTSASTREKAVLFSAGNPYSIADLSDCAELAPYRREIELSRALDGKGTSKLPPGKELWEFQRATLDYLLARGGGIDGDQPGLGKTPTAIAFCNEVEAVRVLVIVPATVRTQWGERIREWSTVPNVKVSVMLKVKDGIHPTANLSGDFLRCRAQSGDYQGYRENVLGCVDLRRSAQNEKYRSVDDARRAREQPRGIPAWRNQNAGYREILRKKARADGHAPAEPPERMLCALPAFRPRGDRFPV